MDIARNQQRRMMSLLFGIALLLALTSNYNVEAYRHEKYENDYSNVKYLRQLIRQLGRSDNNQLFFQSRAEAEGDCTADILDGYQWSGQESMSIPGVDTTQRCMDNCDTNDKCIGWSYKHTSKMCWGFSSIKGVVQVANVRSGSCVGTNIKSKCTENRKGQYPGFRRQSLDGIATVEDCITSCDKLNICFGWLYDQDDKKCYLFSSVGKFQEDNYFLTGSCFAPQKRIRLAEPLKIFRKDVLERHNDKRKMYCVPDLTLDLELNKASQELANQLAAADVTPPVYEETTLQNVYFNKGDAALHGGTIVDGFFDEYKYYKPESPDFSLTNHFPKIIWKSSTKLGVGRAFTSDKSTMFVVITYDSPGKLADSYRDNVPKKCT